MARTAGSELLSVPFVREQISAAADKAASFAREDVLFKITSDFECSTTDTVASRERWALAFDSPLEAAYWAWWEALKGMQQYYGLAFNLERHRSVDVGDQRYVVDFVVTPGNDFDGFPLIGIELDGHAFHEKTLEQVTKRNKRDRDLQRAGWTLFHYSFSEFSADPYACAVEPLFFAISSLRRTA